MDATQSLKISYWNEIAESARQAIRTGSYHHKEKEHLIIFVPMKNYNYEWDVIEKLCYPFGSSKCVGPWFCVQGIAHRTYIIPKLGIDR